MGQASTIGLDIAKRVFQAHGADATGRFSKHPTFPIPWCADRCHRGWDLSSTAACADQGIAACQFKYQETHIEQVHYAANYWVSTFFYRYRRDVLGIDEADA